MFENNNCIFFERVFPQSVPLDTLNAVLTTLPKNFWQSWNIFAECPKMIWRMFLREIYFSSKWSSGHLECSFENPVKKVLTTSPKLPAQCLKWFLKSIFFQRIQFSNCFYEHDLCSFDHPSVKLSHKNPKVFLSISDNDMNYIFFKLNFLSSKLFLQTRIVQFWPPCQKKCARSPNFRSMSEKRLKN